jgi:citrate/tricarballylate utilization protein
VPPRSAIAPELVDDGARMAAICNACRYCEGFCAVFPALERRLSFAEADLAYLANLCHNCGSCLYACQYAPPHEFGLDFPRMLAEVRTASYRKYAWPDALAAAFERNGTLVALAAAAMLALFLVGIGAANGGAFFAAHADAEGSFYALMPHRVMAWTFGIVFMLAIVALAVAGARFWRDVGERGRDFADAPPLAQAAGDALSLRYLAGGGDGCTYPDDRPSMARRWFHHATFYGFLLCFAATCVATVYHYALGWHAPYPLASAPVVLGALGGVGLLIGPAGLLWLKARRDPALVDRRETGMDAAFLVLLALGAATGLLLLALRETPAMGTLLALHLGAVMGLFVTLPFGKFVHAVHRFVALVRYHVERARPLPDIGSE